MREEDKTFLQLSIDTQTILWDVFIQVTFWVIRKGLFFKNAIRNTLFLSHTKEDLKLEQAGTCTLFFRQENPQTVPEETLLSETSENSSRKIDMENYTKKEHFKHINRPLMKELLRGRLSTFWFVIIIAPMKIIFPRNVWNGLWKRHRKPKSLYGRNIEIRFFINSKEIGIHSLIFLNGQK